VYDTVNPVIAPLPQASTIECREEPSFAQASATDACDASVSLTYVDSVNGDLCPFVHTRTWTATDECGNTSTASQVITVECCPQGEFCSLTQGYWGNPGGYKCYNGQQLGTLAILDALIPPGDPLVMGIKGIGMMSLTINHGSEQCIIDRLPGGGPASSLSDDPTFGDEVLAAPGCQTDPPLEVHPKTGRWRNQLLAQAITLALNTRFDSNISDLELCEFITTTEAEPGPDGCLGSEDDVPNIGSILTVQIPASVLSHLGGNNTVAGLLALADSALAGFTFSDVSLTDIAGACGAINEGFDECRFVESCTQNDPGNAPDQERVRDDRNDIGTGSQGSSFGVGLPARFGLFPALPNPTRSSSSVRFALPEASRVRIALYNIRGQEIGVLVDNVMDKGYKTVGVDLGGRGLPSGIYLYRLQATGVESGTRFTETQKVFLIQ
jgi:hypothetical protein